MIEIQTPYGCFSVPRATLLSAAKFVVELNNDDVAVVIGGTAPTGASYSYYIGVGVGTDTQDLLMSCWVVSHSNERVYEARLDYESTGLTEEEALHLAQDILDWRPWTTFEGEGD